MFGSNDTVSEALDELFARDTGIYGTLEDLPLAWQAGHHRRMALLDKLDIGDVSPMVCVDFGCGSWGFADIYPRLHNCAFAYGFDISATAIEQSARLTREQSRPYKDRCRYMKSDGMGIPLDDASVDLLFAGEAIEHMRFPLRFLAECYRVLRPGGQIIVTTPNRDGLLYRIQGDIYGNWNEHFWLCNWPELQASMSEFFEIEESFGFNGSIYRDLDKTATDRTAADLWASQFEDRPDLASGLICRARKRRTDVTARYELSGIPPESIRVEGPSMRLETGLGLFGTMIDSPVNSIAFECSPGSDGVAIVMWSHPWSGYCKLTVGDEVRRVSLWAQDPGWRPYVFDLDANQTTRVTITAEGTGDPRSLANQAIFCEAFTYKR